MNTPINTGWTPTEEPRCASKGEIVNLSNYIATFPRTVEGENAKAAIDNAIECVSLWYKAERARIAGDTPQPARVIQPATRAQLTALMASLMKRPDNDNILVKHAVDCVDQTIIALDAIQDADEQWTPAIVAAVENYDATPNEIGIDRDYETYRKYYFCVHLDGSTADDMAKELHSLAVALSDRIVSIEHADEQRGEEEQEFWAQQTKTVPLTEDDKAQDAALREWQEKHGYIRAATWNEYDPGEMV